MTAHASHYRELIGETREKSLDGHDDRGGHGNRGGHGDHGGRDGRGGRDDGRDDRDVDRNPSLKTNRLERRV